MLLDTAALYFRAFHALPETITAPDGTPIGAVRGLLDIVARLVTDFRPGRLIACWDDDWRPAWRVELVPSYKAHRLERRGTDGRDVETVPPALTAQVPVIREVLGALRIPVVGKPGYEADDVIGTLAATADGPVDVVTSDRDLFQVIDDARGVRVLSAVRGMRNLETVTDAVLREKYGISAAQYADFATLRGDPSDGLPGVPGIGEKTAAGLLAEFGDLDGLITAAADPAVPLGATVRGRIRDAGEYLERARRVVAVVRDLDLPAADGAVGLPADAAEDFTALAERWGLGGSATRALTALGSA
ncbi:5'-3' exonuclease [Amnibacterium sp. CER49]|uniref:5'-3' exonuclease n=1 Tax=Amnibacterium sp. CER49 TaxID=3039161 RepID=UPI0024478D9A|nr:5'-3' exonuclease [Amnibacterium sp. CER49]MDH2442878.1 5'-3' exonuclease [Amnibacterium sp. CER49]